MEASSHSYPSYPPSGAAACQDSRQQWFAVSTMPRHEKTVAQHLAQRGIENYVPLYQALRKWKDRQVWLDLPLFSCYVFVHIAESNRGKVVRTPGVVRIVSFNGVFLPVTDEEMNCMRRLLELWKAEPFPYLTKGKNVRIVAGPLEGLEGVVVHRKGKKSVVISVHSIMRSFKIEVDAHALQLA